MINNEEQGGDALKDTQLKCRNERVTRVFRIAQATSVLGVSFALFCSSGLAMLQGRYDREYPVIGYSQAIPTDPVSRLKSSVDSGEVTLKFDARNGYLISLLDKLSIDLESQLLVFSKTSSQIGQISPDTPRAIYFNDEVYVGWVQGGREIEISALDKDLGPVFFTLAQDEGSKSSLKRETDRCLRCHDSYSMTGGGVPRYLMGSMFPDDKGKPVTHEGWYLTTDRTPLSERWGGWYVTGKNGGQFHMGNLIITNASDPKQYDLQRGTNVTDLGKLIEIDPYPAKYSDIVALLVFEHQVYIQNLIVRANWDTRSAIAKGIPTRGEIAKVAEPLLRAMLFVQAAPILGSLAGISGFEEQFVSRGRLDSEGRTLRELNLKERLFMYPCSYLIYSSAFNALPGLVKDYIYGRLNEVLVEGDNNKVFSHISIGDRQAIAQILKATKPDFAEFIAR